MLIFDRFPTTESADAFAKETGGTVYKSQAESDAVDPFPYVLEAPIVLVPRPELGDLDREVAAEREVAASVVRFGGSFAGT